MTETGLTPAGIGALSLTAKDVVTVAKEQADILMDIVEQTKCYQNISGKKYLQVEAWETIGAFNRVHAETDWTQKIEENGNVVGYESKVNLLKDGQIVGSAIMPCFFSENACKGKDGDAKHKAAMSASQTFATSKAYRMNYSYVAILAGYEPAPADEMVTELREREQEKKKEQRPEDKQHWCKEHNTEFFKKGRMKNFAHKIEGTDDWCNEETEKTPPAAAEATTSPPAAPSKGNIHIDMDSLRGHLEAADWADVLAYLKDKYGATGNNVREVVPLLSKEQQEEFYKEAEDRRHEVETDV